MVQAGVRPFVRGAPDLVLARPVRQPTHVGRRTHGSPPPSPKRDGCGGGAPQQHADGSGAARAARAASQQRGASLRRFLVHAAAGPHAHTDGAPLQQLLADKLGLPAPDFDRWWPAAAGPWEAAAAAAGAGGPRAAAAELAAGLDALLGVLTRQEAARLLQAQPALLAAPLASWRAFFDAMGFSREEQRGIIMQCPELMVKGTVANAGVVIRHLCELGFEEDAVRHRVVAWCPQVLAMAQDDVTNLIRLWSKFSVGVDERAGM